MIALVRALCSGLADVTDATIQTAIDAAYTRLDPSEWGQLYSQAVALMAGHILHRSGAVTGATVGAGTLTAQSTGSLSESYGGRTSSADAEMLSTQPGADYVALRKRIILGARTC